MDSAEASPTVEAPTRPQLSNVAGSSTAKFEIPDDRQHNEKPGSVEASETVHVPSDPEKPKAAASGDPEDDREAYYVDGWPLVVIFVGMLLSIFLVALDQTIVSTAIPRIASEFNALEQVTWIASAYFLTQAGFILTYGKILAVIPTKWVYMVAVMLFEIGSAICGSAPSLNVLIFGRALAGTGAAGIFTSCLSIIARITRLEQRPLLFGAFGAVFTLASIAGPLLGGVFTQHVSWRWCFYINLPFGAITVVTIVLFIKKRHSIIPATSHLTAWEKFMSLDWIGTILCLGMVTSLLLPLQWGGVTKPWSDKSVIALFCVFAVLLPAFIAWEWYQGDNAILPLKLFRSKTQVGCCLEAFFLFLVLLCCAYYLPLFYQSADQVSPQRSGIDILTFMMCSVVGTLVSGATIKMTGRPKPFLVCAPLLSALGSILVFWNLTGSPSTAKLLGFQVLLGIGVGAAFQNTVICIQAEYHDTPRMVPQSTSLVNFTQLGGGVIGIAIAGTIFGNRLATAVHKYAPDLSEETIIMVRSSVTYIGTLQGADKAGVIKAYAEALGYVFILGIPAAILASFSGLLVTNFDLRELSSKKGTTEPAIAV